MYDDRIHRVEYEGLHTICFDYGIFGHKQEHCPNKNNPVHVEEPAKVNSDEVSDPNQAEAV